MNKALIITVLFTAIFFAQAQQSEEDSFIGVVIGDGTVDINVSTNPTILALPLDLGDTQSLQTANAEENGETAAANEAYVGSEEEELLRYNNELELDLSYLLR